MDLRNRLSALGLAVPAPVAMPAGVIASFNWVRVVGERLLVSGHGPVTTDGSPAGPFGRVPDQVSLQEAQQSARLVAASVMADVERTVGDLDRIDAWVTVTGFVQAEPGWPATTAVLNSFSEVVLEVFGPAGEHARTAIGVAALPLDLPVVVAAELHLSPAATRPA